MYFVGSFSQIHRRLYSVGRCSVVEWVLSVPSKVRFFGSFWRYRLGSFLSATKNGKTPTFEWMDQARHRKIPSNRGDSPDSLERTLSGRCVYYGIG
jgi:hypothetical protein